MKMPIGALILGVTLASAPCAMAQEAATPYPDPQCSKPDLIKPPLSNNDTAQVGIYNAKVKLFNRDAKAYNDCVRAYIDKANLEVTRIHDQAGIDQKRLADNANAAMKDVQDKIQRALAESNALIAAQNNTPSR